MGSLKRVIFLTFLCTCLGVGNVVGQDDENEEGDLNSVAEAPIKLRVGKTLTLTCNLTNVADDNAVVTWVKDDNEEEPLEESEKYKIFPKNHTLMVLNSEQEDAGTYECSAPTSKTPFTKLFSVYFFQYHNMPKSLVVIEGEPISMTCEAKGKPIPTVQWYKDGQKINETERFKFTSSGGIAKAKFDFENAQQEDRGQYMCQIFSDMGIYNTSTYVRVKSVYAPLYPLAGIVIEILLLVVVIIFFERRAAKQEYEESDTDQGGSDMLGHAKRQ